MRRGGALVLLVAAACSSPTQPGTRWMRPPPDAAAGLDAVGPTSDAGAGARPGPVLRLPRGARPLAYHLRLELDPAQPRFTGEVTIDVELTEASDRLWLHAVGLTVTEARFVGPGATLPLRVGAPAEAGAGTGGPAAGAPAGAGAEPGAEPGAEMIALAAPTALPVGVGQLRLRYQGVVDARDQVGLFRVDQDGAAYLYTQLEATFARRLVPCFDEPAFKVPWTVAVVAPADLVVAGNTLVTRQHQLADGRVETQFAPTAPLPSYLLALAVGPFEVLALPPVGARRLPARILVPRGQAASTRIARTLIPRVIRQLEDYFGRPLPFDKLDNMVMPRFSGAMENVGLITYANDEFLVDADDGPEARRDLHELIAHELAHQWFGNLVTMAWWDDLWLNEAFATWMARKVIGAAAPGPDDALAAHQETVRAMQLDAEAGAPALHRLIGSNADIEDAFDAIAYEKGARVLAMFEAYLEEDRFRDAVRGYLAAHAGGSATSADFAAAIEQAAGAEARDALLGLIAQPGVPVVSTQLVCDQAAPGRGGARAVVTVERLAAGAVTPSPWQLPVCVRVGAAGAAARCALVGARAELALPGAGCPATVLANPGAVGYYRVAPAGPITSATLDAMSDRERLALADDVGALHAAGRWPLASLDELARRLLGRREPLSLVAALDLIEGVRASVVLGAMPAWEAWARRTIEPRWGRPAQRAAGGWIARERLYDLLVLARSTLITAEATRLASGWLRGADLRTSYPLPAIVAAAVRSGAPLSATVLLQRARGADPDEREVALAALAELRAPADVGLVLEALASGGLPWKDGHEVLAGLLARPELQAQVEAWMSTAGPAVLAQAAPSTAADDLFDALAAACDRALLERVVAATPAVAALAGAGAALERARRDADSCAARRRLSANELDALR